MNNGMNWVALIQGVYHNALNLGQQQEEVIGEPVHSSEYGWPIYIKGKGAVPEITEIKLVYALGSIYHPALVLGMPSVGGDISYFLGEADTEMTLLIRLKLDESAYGDSDPVEDLAAVLTIEDMRSHHVPGTTVTVGDIGIDLLREHFKHFSMGDLESFAKEITVIDDSEGFISKCLKD